MLRSAARILLTVSVVAGAVENVRIDTAVAAIPAVRDTATRAVADSPTTDSSASKGAKDTTLAKRRSMVKDTVAAKAPVGLPPRVLSFQEQLVFALVFMSFIGVMLASLTNINP